MTGLAESAKKVAEKALPRNTYLGWLDVWAEAEIRKLEEHMNKWFMDWHSPSEHPNYVQTMDEVLRYLRNGETEK